MTDAETRMIAVHTALADTRSLAEAMRRMDLGGLGTDTIMAIGFMLGTIDKAKALVGRDIDDERRRRTPHGVVGSDKAGEGGLFAETRGPSADILWPPPAIDPGDSFHGMTARLFAAIKAADRAR